MLDADTDGDGYSNREEFLAGTNPRDPNSMPGMIDGVSMKELQDVRVPIILREVKGGKARVERMDGAGQEELREGSQPKGLPYRVTAIKQEVKADKHGVFTDVSQVTMKNPATKELVVLVRDMPARSRFCFATSFGTRMRTGSRCTILVKLPVALSGGSSVNTEPAAGEMLSTVPANLRRP